MPKTVRAKGRRSKRSDLKASKGSKSGVPSRSQQRLKEKEDHTAEAPTDSTAMTGQELVSRLRLIFTRATALHAKECTAYAPVIKKYMKNKFEFFGFKAPLRRQLQKEFEAENSEHLQNRELLMEFLLLLWSQEERDFQGVGCDMAAQKRKLLLGESDNEFTEAVRCARTMVETKSWWDTVDAISYPVVGYFVEQRPEMGRQLMQQWIAEDNLWLRRVAILHQLARKGSTDKDLLFSFCLQRAHEKEFFIQKAIGWALRTYARTDKASVKRFVEENRSSLAPLSIREALKHVH